MKAFNDVKGKDVLSNDGRYMGKLVDLTYDGDFKIDELVTKMNKEVIDDLERINHYCPP